MNTHENEKMVKILPELNKYLHPEDDLIMLKALLSLMLEGKPSVNYLQRTLGISYNRAAEILEIMEARGVVTAPSSVGWKREIALNGKF